jgi:hypothetical protein
MYGAVTLKRGISYSAAIAAVRSGPLGGRWLFAWVFLAQLGHLIEHISVAIQGKALLGAQFDSEISHLLFNGVIAILSVVLVLVYPRNPWVYPLMILSIFHGIEHVYIYDQFLKTGVSNGPGLLGLGGVIGVIPLGRIDLHNVYNGLEVVLMVLGLSYEFELGLMTNQLRSSDARDLRESTHTDDFDRATE